ncbi:class I SAM-dependent methyltransferase [Micromonospora sp. BQ11]|uniref:class I SAM-dependent methyltransferase n=1 Tax=Micromonospora sp. BQ11 TaxID=3452212 RepID=UPI003F899959
MSGRTLAERRHDQRHPPAARPVYDRIGVGYSHVRRPDPRWAATIRHAVGDARTVLNVGAGSGAYEPVDLAVTAVEPSAVMRAQRPPSAPPCVAGRAEDLPFDDDSFDVAMAVLTVHHWSDLEAGLGELRRVARRFVVVSYDMAVQGQFWLTRDYIPEIEQAERARVPELAHLADLLGPAEISDLPIPADFTDGFMTAFWRRPAAYLDEQVRRACSAFALTDAAAVARGIDQLRGDLDDGTWADRYAPLLDLDQIDAGFRLLTGVSPRRE